MIQHEYIRSVGFSLGGGPWKARHAVVCLLVREVVSYSFANLVFANTRPCTRFKCCCLFVNCNFFIFLCILQTQTPPPTSKQSAVIISRLSTCHCLYNMQFCNAQISETTFERNYGKIVSNTRRLRALVFKI